MNQADRTTVWTMLRHFRMALEAIGLAAEGQDTNEQLAPGLRLAAYELRHNWLRVDDILKREDRIPRMRPGDLGLPTPPDYSHDYPGIYNGEFVFTSDCSFGCGAWMGGARSGAPDGVDPFGDCPVRKEMLQRAQEDQTRAKAPLLPREMGQA